MAIEEGKKKVELSLGLLWSGVTSIVFVTFTLTTIYWNFVQMGKELDHLSAKEVEDRQEIEEKLDYLDGRIDRKFQQLKKESELND